MNCELLVVCTVFLVLQPVVPLAEYWMSTAIRSLVSRPTRSTLPVTSSRAYSSSRAVNSVNFVVAVTATVTSAVEVRWMKGLYGYGWKATS